MKNFYFVVCIDGYVDAKNEKDAKKLVKGTLTLARHKAISDIKLTNIKMHPGK